jgi:hypothetical protein
MNLQGTLKVATVKAETVKELEIELSIWLELNHVDIVKIHFTSLLDVNSDFIQHSAIILYYK